MSAERDPQGHRHGPEGHQQARAEDRRRLTAVLVLVAAYMLAEFVGGLLTNSLALLADAAHMLSDAAALGLSLFALWVARRPPTPRHSYGYYRAEVLAALANGASLLAVSAYVLVEAYRRLHEPQEVMGPAMAAIAAGGLAVNLAGLWLLRGRHAESLNVRGAWLHLLGDALGSVAAVAAAALVWAFGWNWADPVASAGIALLVIYSSWSLLRQSVAILMEASPGHVDVDQVRDALAALAGVREVHELHVWAISSGIEVVSAHLVVEDGRPHEAVLREAGRVLSARFGIDHVTLQLEPADFHGRPAPP